MRTLFTRLIFLVMIMITIHFSYGQEFFGLEAHQRVSGAKKIWIKEGCTIPSFIAFAPGYEISEEDALPWIQRQFGFDDQYTLVTVNEEIDYRGDAHRRVKLATGGIPLFDAMWVLHIRNEKIYAINGDIPQVITITNSIQINESAALQYALDHIGAVRYKWQMPEEETLLRSHMDNPSATYFPSAEMVLYRSDKKSDYQYAYIFNIYADQPLYRAEVFVDATSGNILFENKLIRNADALGTTVTKYSGNQVITADSTGTAYRLRETGRGNGIETYNMLKGTSYGSAVDFTDSDNHWNNFNSNLDEVATDAHWGAEMTYDYYWTKFGRNSINNQGLKLMSYVHYDNNYANAFWDGQRMTYGDGNGGSTGPLTALDIIAHEITHGVTSYTAELIYQNESGALNESFSDIFGVSVEWFAKPAQANWTMGENIGMTIRSISNPKSKGLPDTYQGTYWYTGTGDDGGVHTNCGPYSHWFYLLSNGGSGSNDKGHNYSVTGITIDSAAAIAYRTLVVYLTNSSNYTDARYYSIQSAIDLFGACSQQVESTTKALYAIGVGNDYIPGVISDFSAPMTSFCQAPAPVSFNNMSNNGSSFFWDFGDGITSTQASPTHTYTANGTYTVTLITSGGSCGIDTLVKSNYIDIDPKNPCVYNMSKSGTITNTNCHGFLYDSGGNQNYDDNTNSTFIIAPPGAMSVTLTFSDFSFETGYDYLYVYDGTGVTAPLIGQYTGQSLPNGGAITSLGGSITLRQVTDQYVNEQGFLLGWNCNYPTAAPVTDFIVSDTVTCSGEITFLDVSTNGPDSWSWNLGDGNAATTKIVNHTYQYSGFYTVTLITSNIFGGDTITKNAVVHVELPYPDIPSQALCNTGSVTFENPDTNKLTLWYDDPVAAIPFHTGSSYTTPTLNQTITYWVEEIVDRTAFSGAKADNAGGGAYFTAAVQHYLVFDVYKPSVLKTVKIYAGSAGNRTIELQNSNGTVLKSTTVNLTLGVNTVTLNFELTPGNDYRLAGSTSPNLYRNSGGINYPYHISDLISVKQSSASTNPTAYYYFFYQWVASELPCISPKVPVTLFVNQTTPVTDFNFVVNDAMVNFSDKTINSGVNTWSFGDGQTDMGTNPAHQYGAVGTYQVTLHVDNGCGIDSKTKPVTIQTMNIEEPPSKNILKVYPNPTNGMFTVVLPNSTEGIPETILLRDITGRIISVDINSSNNNTLIISTLKHSPGVYFLSVKMGDQIYQNKIIFY